MAEQPNISKSSSAVPIVSGCGNICGLPPSILASSRLGRIFEPGPPPISEEGDESGSGAVATVGAANAMACEPAGLGAPYPVELANAILCS